MATTLLVGLDVGTTTTKAVAFSDTGEPVATGSASTPWTVTPTGAETTAQDLLDSATTALAALLSDCPPGHIAGLGVTGLAESGVLVDRSGSSVAPVIAWHDTRDGVELAELRAGFGDEFAATTGLPLRQQWSLTKHRWLTRHVPEVTAAVRRFNVPEWIVKALGGEEATEQSLASRTGWRDLAGRRWWPEALDWSGAAESLMPPLVTAGTALGRVSADAALGRLTGAALTVAGHDHQVAAIGANAAGVGDQLDSCGTAEALVRTRGSRPRPRRGRRPGGRGYHRRLARRGRPLVPARRDAGRPGAGANPGDAGSSRDELDRAALAVSSPSVRVNAPAFGRIDIHGIGDDASPAQVWLAALETVTDQAAELHDAMTAASGPHRSFVVTGGWSTSQALLEVKRRRFGAITVAPITQTGARGAALLAGLAAGATTSADAFPACV